MEECLRKYRISSRGQRTRGDPTAWGLGEDLINPQVKTCSVTRYFRRPRKHICNSAETSVDVSCRINPADCFVGTIGAQRNCKWRRATIGNAELLVS
jgi:hypothetical protein